MEPYYDSPQSIGYNATISAPHMHVFALETSQLVTNPQRILDIGSGSGYLTACYAQMYPDAQVVGIEHIPELVELSTRNVHKHHPELMNRIKFVVGDGRKGYAPNAPYDIIHVGAAATTIPDELSKQLAVDGLMIIPVGENFQEMTIVRKLPNGKLQSQRDVAVRYVPLTDREAQYRS